jgi:crossover junction endodeoxyribonuclease RuvC
LILGIDPGTRVTGYALVEQEGRELSAVESGVIRLDTRGGLPARLTQLHRALTALLDRYHPTAAAVEDVFSARNARSALALGHARGVVLAVVGSRDVPILAYAPAMVKRAVVGHGRAEKAQIQQMVKVLLSLERLPATDEADAIAVAMCHALCGGSRGELAPERLASPAGRLAAARPLRTRR